MIDFEMNAERMHRARAAGPRSRAACGNVETVGQVVFEDLVGIEPDGIE